MFVVGEPPVGFNQVRSFPDYLLDIRCVYPVFIKYHRVTQSL